MGIYFILEILLLSEQRKPDSEHEGRGRGGTLLMSGRDESTGRS